MIHSKYSNGSETWYEYDSNGNLIHTKDSDGYEAWNKYDAKGNKIYCETNSGYEYWYDYDYNGNLIHQNSAVKKSIPDKKKREIMEDLHKKLSHEYWYEYEYDSNNKIKGKTAYISIK